MPNISNNLLIYVKEGGNNIEAQRLASTLGISICENNLESSDVLTIVFDSAGVALVQDKMEMRADFTRMIPRLKQNNLNKELLVKAAKIKGSTDTLKAIDATAGLGEDSLLLAAAGFEVDLYELDPIIAIMLKDALYRSNAIPELASAVSRMHLHVEDSIVALQNLSYTPDIVLLDPMFPERKKSASVKKKFQLIHQLERPCSNEEDLLKAALNAGPRKVVIKRPVKGPYLAGIKPAYSLVGKAVRYDCLVQAR